MPPFQDEGEEIAKTSAPSRQVSGRGSKPELKRARTTPKPSLFGEEPEERETRGGSGSSKSKPDSKSRATPVLFGEEGEEHEDDGGRSWMSQLPLARARLLSTLIGVHCICLRKRAS